MKSLLELRKEAQTLGIENFAKYSKEELAAVIEQKKAGITVAQDPEVIVSEEEAQDLAEKEAAGEVETISAEDAGELTLEGKKKLKPEEKLAARKAAQAKAKADKEAEKAAKKAAKEAAKEAKKAEKEAAKKERKEARPTVAMTNFIPKGEKPVFRSETSSKIYDELLKNDGRSYGAIAKALGTHYNMVRNVAEQHFTSGEATEAPTAEADPAPTQEASEAEA